MAIINTKPDMNMGIWAEGGNIEIPSDTKIDEGWVVEKPLNEYMNFVQNRQDRMLQYINQRGIPEWDLRTEYPTNAHVARAGKIYKALSLNTDADPLNNPSIWVIAFASYEEFFTLAQEVSNIKNIDGYLNTYVSKQTPILDDEAKGYGYLNTTGEHGLSFDGDKAVIKQNGVSVAEFSGQNNPKDVVTFEQLTQLLQTYKVGDLYLTTNPQNPTVSLGYGSWERYGMGRALVGFSDSISNNVPEWVKVGGREYGSYTHTLTTDELPSTGLSGQEWLRYDGSYISLNRSGGYSQPISTPTIIPSLSGIDKPHNNVQPSIVVYIWRRTA